MHSDKKTDLVRPPLFAWVQLPIYGVHRPLATRQKSSGSDGDHLPEQGDAAEP
jgi:hypothetical protein